MGSTPHQDFARRCATPILSRLGQTAPQEHCCVDGDVGYPTVHMTSAELLPLLDLHMHSALWGVQHAGSGRRVRG